MSNRNKNVARLLYDLVEPVHLVTYFADEPTDELMKLGHEGYWEGYFAGRAAPLGPAQAPLVHAVFFHFAEGEVARHLPHVWDTATPEASLSARERGSAAALRRILGPLASSPRVASAADLATRAATSAPTEGRALYACLRALPIPQEPVARLWHAATLLREHRGDGHVAALVAAGIGGTEAHVLHALSQGIIPHEFGRLHHLAASEVNTVLEGLGARGLIDPQGQLSDLGRATKQSIEERTDELAAPAYDVLTADELVQLVTDLRPVADALTAAGSR